MTFALNVDCLSCRATTRRSLHMFYVLLDSTVQNSAVSTEETLDRRILTLVSGDAASPAAISSSSSRRPISLPALTVGDNMARRLLTFCLTPGCPERVESGRCDKHKRVVSREYHAQESQKFYQKREWKALSLRFRQANPLCATCLKAGRIVESQVVDHIISIKNGGDEWEEANLQALCVPCHNAKTVREQNARK